MKRRWPLLLSLLPLLLGLAVYGHYWRGWAAGFETTLARWFPGERISVSGFPYRLEAELVDVKRAHQGGIELGMAVGRLRLNRGPWRPELTVFQGKTVALAASVAGLAARVNAASATASLKILPDRAGVDRLARLSILLPAATGNAGFGPDFRADTLELHLREIVGLATPTSPRLPPRGQFVIGATGFALGQGAPISLDADVTARGPGRLDDHARWAAAGGSLDVKMTGRDATGELFRLDASLVPLGTGNRLAGTIVTVCPLAVQAALNGAVPPPEQRLRTAVTLALETAIPSQGPVALSGIPADLATRSRRGQLPGCPKLR